MYMYEPIAGRADRPGDISDVREGRMRVLTSVVKIYKPSDVDENEYIIRTIRPTDMTENRNVNDDEEQAWDHTNGSSPL